MISQVVEGDTLDTGQYFVYTISGLAVIALLAWLMDYLWKQSRRGHQRGGAAGFLFKLLGGYEPTPVAESDFRPRGPEAEHAFESPFTEDASAAWAFLYAPTATIDAMFVRHDKGVIALSGRGATIMSTALAATPRTVRRALRTLTPRRDGLRAPASGGVVAASGTSITSSLSRLRRASHVYLARGAHTVELNRDGWEFVDALLSAPVRSIEAAEKVLGLRAARDYWMPGDEFDRRGGVLKPYDE
jgi:hypothetical protein